MEQVISIANEREPNPLDTTGLCLLSLDGGGVRGLSTLYILKSIMDRLNHKRKDNNLPPLKPCEVFDLIGGTSTGGLIAIMLGRLEMNVDECIAQYSELAADVFGEKLRRFPFNTRGSIEPRFDSNKLRSAIRKVVKTSGASETDLLNDGTEHGCRTFVCTVDRHTKDIVRLRSYSLPDEPNVTATICEAALATSAATTFFEPVSIGDRSFGDGGLGANNPVDEVEGEASNIWCATGDLKPLVKCFISIGTGNPGKKPFHDGALKFLGKTVVQIATETENTEKKFIARWARHFDQKRYFRFNVEQGLQSIGLEEHQKRGLMEAATEAYLTHMAQRLRVRDCVQNISLKQNKTGISFGSVINEYIVRTILLQRDNNTGLSMTTRPEWKAILSRDSIQGSDLLERLSSYSYQREYSRRMRQKLENTTDWIIKEPDFKSWLYDGHPQCLWLTGIIGCGKSITLTTVIHEVFIESQKSRKPVLYYFFNHSFRRHLTARALFESYTKQLLYYLELIGKNCPLAVIDRMVEFYGPKKLPPSLDEVVDELMTPLLETARESILIIDGLDECTPNESQRVLRVLKKLLATFSIRIFFACREDVDITRMIPGAIRIRITPEKTNADMKLFVERRLESMQSYRRISDNEDMLAYIKEELLKKADRMFLWAELQIQFLWENCSGVDAIDEMIYKSLEQLPEDLDEVYQACQRKINQDERKLSLANKAVKLIGAAEEPFQVSQLQEALAVDRKTGELTHGLIHKDELMACCTSFVYREWDGVNELVLLAHYSVRQFLLAYLQISHDAAKLELGELCITHLHRQMPVRELTLRAEATSTSLINVPILGGIASTFANVVAPQLLRRQKPRYTHSVQLRLPAPAPRTGVVFDPKSFLYFAKLHWTSTTRHFSMDSSLYSKFKDISLLNSKIWWIYPWERRSDSDILHVSAIYDWSIMNSHYALLKLAINQQKLFNWERSLLPLQAAAQIGDLNIAKLLLEVLPRKSWEDGRPSPLHIAILEDHPPIISLLSEVGVTLIFAAALQTLEGHSGVSAVAFSPDGKQMASASRDGTIGLWHVGSASALVAPTVMALQTLKGHFNLVTAITFSPNGKLLASASDDGTIKLWHVGSASTSVAATAAALQTLKGHSERVNAVAFSPDGKLLVSASFDGTIGLWHIRSTSASVAETTAALQTLKDYSSPVAAIAFSPNGKLLASASFDHTIKLWHVESASTSVAAIAAVLQTLKGHPGWGSTVAFSPGGKLLALGSLDGTINLWHVRSASASVAATATALQTLEGHSDYVSAIAFSPDGKLLASASADKTIRLWHVRSASASVAATAAALQTLESHSNRINAVAFSPDGKLLASASDDNTISLWHTGY